VQYLLLVYTDESAGPTPGSTEEEVMWVAHEEFTRHMTRAGRVVEGKALHPSDTATTVRRREGAMYASDGPFEQTDEQLAGFYLIEADDLDEAIETAANVPCAAYGSIEVRPVVDISPKVQ